MVAVINFLVLSFHIFNVRTFALINLVCVVFLFQFAHDSVILSSAFHAGLHFPRTLDEEQILGALDCLKPMGDHNDCQIAGHLSGDSQNSRLDFSFTFRVKSARGFVKHQYLWLLEQGTGNRNSLLLAA